MPLIYDHHASFWSKNCPKSYIRLAKGGSFLCAPGPPSRSATVYTLHSAQPCAIGSLTSFPTLQLGCRSCCGRSTTSQQRHSLSRRALNRMAVKCTYKIGQGMNEMCSICLEEFTEGEQVRELPCLHGELCACVRVCVDIAPIQQFFCNSHSVPRRMCRKMAEGVQAHMSPL